MFNKKSVDIAVLGAGPAGLTAAHVLADRGMDFVLLERAANPHTHSYALALHPDTMELLDAIGVADDVLKNSMPLRRVAIFDTADNHQRAVIDYSSLPCKYACLSVIGQNRLESILADSLAKKGHAAKWQHRVRCIEPTSEKVHFTVDRLSQGMTGYAVAHMEPEIDKIFEYQANYLIGCDGYASMTRNAASIDFPVVAEPMDYAVFEFQTNVKLFNEMRMMVDGDKTHIYWPLGENRCRFSFQMPSGFAKRHSFDKDNHLIDTEAQKASELSNAHLDHLLRQHAPWFIGSSENVVWRVMVHFERRLATSFGEGRIWLAGDAAHMAAPAGMLSMNVGMLEAADLAEKLSKDTSDAGREFRLGAYAIDRENEWHSLFDIGQHIYGLDASADWLLDHRSNLIGNLPASGQILSDVFQQLHLSETVAA